MLFCRFRHFYTQIAACTCASCSARARSACVLLSPTSPARSAAPHLFTVLALVLSPFARALPAPQPLNPPRARSACVSLSLAPPARRSASQHLFTVLALVLSPFARAFPPHFPHRSLSTLPAHAALAFCFCPPRHAQVIFCKAARAAAIASPPAPQRLCPTRQHLRHTPPSVNISRAFSQNRAIPRQNTRHAARIPRIAPPRSIPRCVPSSRAISRHAPPACRFSRPNLLHYLFSMQKAQRISISRACKQRVFAMPRHFFACLPPGRSMLPATNHRRAQKSFRLSQIMPKWPRTKKSHTRASQCQMTARKKKKAHA